MVGNRQRGQVRHGVAVQVALGGAGDADHDVDAVEPGAEEHQRDRQHEHAGAADPENARAPRAELARPGDDIEQADDRRRVLHQRAEADTDTPTNQDRFEMPFPLRTRGTTPSSSPVTISPSL